MEYVHKAMKFYQKGYGIDRAQFVISCENLAWCVRELDGPGVHFAVGGSTELDLVIQSRCDHSILTGSSLSWWSAFLSGGHVTYDGLAQTINGMPTEIYALPGWVAVDL